MFDQADFSMILLVLATFLVAVFGSLCGLAIDLAGQSFVKVGVEIKGRWDREDHFWVLNTSESTSLLTCLLSIFISSYLVSYEHTCYFWTVKFFVFNYLL